MEGKTRMKKKLYNAKNLFFHENKILQVNTNVIKNVAHTIFNQNKRKRKKFHEDVKKNFFFILFANNEFNGIPWMNKKNNARR